MTRLLTGLVLWIGIAVPLRADLVTQFNLPFTPTIFSGAGSALSQYDTGLVLPDPDGDLPNFATAYDNFTLAASAQVGGVSWVGRYDITTTGRNPSFDISFYQNNGTTPGALIQTFNVGSAAETLVVGQSRYFSYQASIAPLSLNANTTYWVSVVGRLNFGVDGWGMAFSNLGDGRSVQDFQNFNTKNIERFTDNVDYAFNLQAVPEPSSLLMVGVCAVALGFSARRRFSRTHLKVADGATIIDG